MNKGGYIMKLHTITFILLISTISHAYNIYWYVGAAMTKPAKKIVNKFNNEHTEDFLYLVTGGSGQNLSKIYSSKTGDIYTPASEFFLQKANKLNIIDNYKVMLINTPVFGLSKSGKTKVQSFEDLCKKDLKIALGNPKTMSLGETFLKMGEVIPVGIYIKIKENKSVEALNITQIIGYLKEDIVDAGLIFNSVAKVNNIDYIKIPEEWNFPVKVYTARLIYTENKIVTNKAINYIYNHLQIFENNGFQVLK